MSQEDDAIPATEREADDPVSSESDVDMLRRVGRLLEELS